MITSYTLDNILLWIIVHKDIFYGYIIYHAHTALLSSPAKMIYSTFHALVWVLRCNALGASAA